MNTKDQATIQCNPHPDAPHGFDGMNLFSIKWCDLFHGGGQVTRDCYDRINWRCSKCGRWAMPVDKQTERLITDFAISKAQEPKP